LAEKARKHSKRHVLLLYQDSMDQIWTACLFFGVVLMAGWFFSGRLLPVLEPAQEVVLITGGILLLAIAAFALLARKGGYVQAYGDHFRLVTPFLRLKISYRRVSGIRASQLGALFPPEKARFLERGSLQPYYSATVVEVDLFEYPLSQHTLRLFLPRHCFAVGNMGLVLLVDDWMSLIQDLDHFSLQWRQTQLEQKTRPLAGTGFWGGVSKR
jgi:hypothetical protein